jgi:hypothetical protein
MNDRYLDNNERSHIEYELYDTLRKMEYILKNAKLTDLEIIRTKTMVDSIKDKYIPRIEDLIP